MNTDFLSDALIATTWALFIALWLRAKLRARRTVSHRVSLPEHGIEAVWKERGLETIPRSLPLFEFRNVIVRDERGTTEIDVILVGNAGIFVIELKEYNAWIFGSEDDEKWTASYFGGETHQFQNPRRQNYRHVKALTAQLGLPINRFHSWVAFSGACEFRTPMPSDVFIGDYRTRVQREGGIRMTDSDVSRVCGILRALETESTDVAHQEHVVSLRERFSNATTCPKCGAPLVQRRSTKATSDGRPFLGCRAFPECTYMRRI